MENWRRTGADVGRDLSLSDDRQPIDGWDHDDVEHQRVPEPEDSEQDMKPLHDDDHPIHAIHGMDGARRVHPANLGFTVLSRAAVLTTIAPWPRRSMTIDLRSFACSIATWIRLDTSRPPIGHSSAASPSMPRAG